MEMTSNIANVLHLVCDKFKNIKRSDLVSEKEKEIAENIIDILNAHVNGNIEIENELEFDGKHLLQQNHKFFIHFFHF